ncbi:MAG: hypothetical protein U0R81_03420 [Mycobacterium sp.]
MDPDDLESRVSSLEQQVSDLNDRVRASDQNAAAARILAGGADRDVGEIRGEIRDFRRATTAGLNALRQDFVDLRDHVDRGFAEMRGKFDAAAAGQAQIIGLLKKIAD